MLTPKDFFDLCRRLAGDSGPYNHHIYTGPIESGNLEGGIDYATMGRFVAYLAHEDEDWHVAAAWDAWESKNLLGTTSFSWCNRPTDAQMTILLLHQ